LGAGGSKERRLRSEGAKWITPGRSVEVKRKNRANNTTSRPRQKANGTKGERKIQIFLGESPRREGSLGMSFS